MKIVKGLNLEEGIIEISDVPLKAQESFARKQYLLELRERGYTCKQAVNEGLCTGQEWNELIKLNYSLSYLRKKRLEEAANIGKNLVA